MPRPKLPAHQLTEREAEVYALLLQGWSNNDIAEYLCISLKTVESHIRNIYGKQAEPLSGQGPSRRIAFLMRMFGHA